MTDANLVLGRILPEYVIVRETFLSHRGKPEGECYYFGMLSLSTNALESPLCLAFTT